MALATAFVLVGPVLISAQDPASLDEFEFLTGCWEGRLESGLHVMEQWTSAEGGLMLYTTRFVRDGAVVDWEFGRLEEADEGVVLRPYPRGTISEHAFPLVSTAGEYVFENLEHDFPVRIVYARVGEDGLRPRIEARDGNGTSWELSRVDCRG